MIADILMLCLMPLYFFVIFTFHEFGHYVVARFFKVSIDGWSVGFGKVIKSGVSRCGETWEIRRFPLSGRVSINQTYFDALSFFKKVILIMAGPVFNVLLAFLVMVPVYIFIGQPSKPPVITAVKVGGQADLAGLQIEDRIVRLNGVAIDRFEQVADVSKQTPVVELDLVIERGGKALEISVTPFDDLFVDRRGIERREGVLGVFASHAPLNLKGVTFVNGVEATDEDHARQLMIDVFDQGVILKMKTGDNREEDYRAMVYSEHNQHLLDEDDLEYDQFYLGSIPHNFYKKVSVLEGVSLALVTTKDMFVNVASLPSQIFPIDGRKVKPETIVHDKQMLVRNVMFRAGFFIGVISIFIGFVNLIPLPHFDGGQLLLLTVQKFKKDELTRKQRARIIVVALVCLYLGVMAANFHKLPRMVDAKIEQLQEFIEDL